MSIPRNLSKIADNVDSSGVLTVTGGGTGATTATTGFNALAPSQTSNSGKLLTTDGTNASWTTPNYASTGKAIAMAIVFGG